MPPEERSAQAEERQFQQLLDDAFGALSALKAPNIMLLSGEEAHDVSLAIRAIVGLHRDGFFPLIARLTMDDNGGQRYIKHLRSHFDSDEDMRRKLVELGVRFHEYSRKAAVVPPF